MHWHPVETCSASRSRFGKAEFGGERWRQLVIGVVLMIGYPKSWQVLARDSELADLLLTAKEPPQAGTGDERSANFNALRGNGSFVALLSETRLHKDLSEFPAKTRINGDVVRWLSQIIPVVSG
jgi:hypothetical protein